MWSFGWMSQGVYPLKALVNFETRSWRCKWGGPKFHPIQQSELVDHFDISYLVLRFSPSIQSFRGHNYELRERTFFPMILSSHMYIWLPLPRIQVRLDIINGFIDFISVQIHEQVFGFPLFFLYIFSCCLGDIFSKQFISTNQVFL
jgi:hypothetical protein